MTRTTFGHDMLFNKGGRMFHMQEQIQSSVFRLLLQTNLTLEKFLCFRWREAIKLISSQTNKQKRSKFLPSGLAKSHNKLYVVCTSLV